MAIFFVLTASEEPAVKRGAILPGADVEFFRQIGVADDLEQPGFRRPGQPIKINRPNLERIRLLPAGKMLRVVHRPESET